MAKTLTVTLEENELTFDINKLTIKELMVISIELDEQIEKLMCERSPEQIKSMLEAMED